MKMGAMKSKCVGNQIAKTFFYDYNQCRKVVLNPFK